MYLFWSCFVFKVWRVGYFVFIVLILLVYILGLLDFMIWFVLEGNIFRVILSLEFLFIRIGIFVEMV